MVASRFRPIMIAVALGLGAGLPDPSAAQVETVTLRHLSREMRVWEADDGLPTGRVGTITQTLDGYLWVSGQGYLARFNGSRFESYDAEKLLGNRLRFIVKFAIDGEGTLWFRSVLGGLGMYRDGEFHAFEVPAELGGVVSLCARPDRGAVVCCRTQDAENPRLVSISPDRSRKVLLTLPSSKAPSLESSRDGNLWIIFRQDGMYKVAGETLQPVPLDGDPPNTFVRHLDGSLGAVSSEAHWVYDEPKRTWSRARTFSPGIPQQIRSACLDRSGHLFLNVRRIQYVVLPDGTTRRIQAGRDQLPTSDRMLATRDGSVWFHSQVGLHQVRYSPFVTWPAPPELISPRFYALAEEAGGRMWFACETAICTLDPGDSAVGIFKAHSSSFNTDLTPHPGGGMWIRRPTGPLELARDGASQRFRLADPATRFDLTVDPDGRAWLGTSSGLYTCHPDREVAFRKIEIPVLPPNTQFQRIEFDSRGRLYAIPYREGILVRAPGEDGEWSQVSGGNSDARNLSLMAVDPLDRMWGASEASGALCLVDPSGIRSRNARDLGIDLLGQIHGGLVFDRLGGAWFGLNGDGIIHCDLEELTAAMKDPSRTVNATHFSQRDGLGSILGPYRAGGITRASDGRIWAATGRGASVIDPAMWHWEREHSAPPPIHIERFSADGNPLPLPDEPGEALTPPVGTGEIRIEFVALDYGRPGEASYRYRLRGLSEGWTEARPEPTAIFQRLAPGKYQFEVLAANRFRAWSKTPATLSFVIEPQWWQRAEFRGAVIAGLIVLVLFLFLITVTVMRRHHARQIAFSRRLMSSQEEERQRLAREMHDGLGQHLLLIKNTAELTASRLDPDAPASEGLREMTEIAEDAIAEARAITENLRPAELDRLGLRIAARSMIDKIAEGTDLQIETSLDDLERDWIQGRDIHLFRVLQECLNNVLKHASANRVAVEAIAVAGDLEITVRDNGIGFDPTQIRKREQPEGRGLTGMRERVKLLGGQLAIASPPGKGTTIRITIPLTGNTKH